MQKFKPAEILNSTANQFEQPIVLTVHQTVKHAKFYRITETNFATQLP